MLAALACGRTGPMLKLESISVYGLCATASAAIAVKLSHYLRGVQSTRNLESDISRT